MLSVKEVAARCNVEPITVYRWIKERNLKADRCRQGLRYVYRILEGDLAEFLQGYLGGNVGDDSEELGGE